MPDRFTEVTRRGYGSRIVGSFLGAIFGILLFFGSFVLLYWNEGRVDLSVIAKTATAADPAVFPPAATLPAGPLAVTGKVTSDELLGDGLYLKAGTHLAFRRTAEMFAWVEHEQSDTHRDVGGSETTTTTYTYGMEWTDSPEGTASFKHPDGHENPAQAVKSSSGQVGMLKVGAWPLRTDGLSLRGYARLPLTKDVIELSGGATLPDNGYVFLGKGSLDSPQLGDVRVSYFTVEPGGTATAFAAYDGTALVQYKDRNGRALFELIPGGKDAAIAALHSEYATSVWVLRLVGWLMMWIGMMLFFGPVSTVLDFLPALGSVGTFLFGVIALPLSLILAAATVVVSRFLHNPLAVGAAIVVVLGIGASLLFKKKAPASPPAAVPPSPAPPAAQP